MWIRIIKLLKKFEISKQFMDKVECQKILMAKIMQIWTQKNQMSFFK